MDGAIKLLSIAYTDEYVYNTMLSGLEDRDYVWMDEELGLIGSPRAWTPSRSSWTLGWLSRDNALVKGTAIL